jgi:hypothetical protein
MSECRVCAELKKELTEAESAGDHSKATDCTVLLRRHPAHDSTPVRRNRPPHS